VGLSLGNELHHQRPPQLTACSKSWVTAGMIKRHGNGGTTSICRLSCGPVPQTLQEVDLQAILWSQDLKHCRRYMGQKPVWRHRKKKNKFCFRFNTEHCSWRRHAVAQWLRHYATNRKIASSGPDDLKESVSNYLMLPAAPGPGVYSESNR
jgi:hypothetical protein